MVSPEFVHLFNESGACLEKPLKACGSRVGLDVGVDLVQADLTLAEFLSEVRAFHTAGELPAAAALTVGGVHLRE